MKSNRFTGTSNQIPLTDETMPDLNHSSIYNTQNSQQTIESCGARMSDNKQSQQSENSTYKCGENDTYKCFEP